MILDLLSLLLVKQSFLLWILHDFGFVVFNASKIISS
jgi:hypothetical protein